DPSADARRGGPNQPLAAWHTAGLRRTSLSALAPPPPARRPPPVVVAPPPPRPPPPPSEAESGVTAGLGGLYSPGGAGTALQVWLSLHPTLGRASRPLGGGGDLRAPARPASPSAAQGASPVQTDLAGR